MQLKLFDFIFGRTRSQPKRRQAQPAQPLPDDPALIAIWLSLRRQWFPQSPEIDDYLVTWSRRPQKRTLASCNLQRRCILVARELRYTQHQIWLEPLLYHEMCHVYLGEQLSGIRGRRAWHGRDFKRLERRHPASRDLDNWLKSGGWATAVRSDRSKRAYDQRLRRQVSA